MKNMQSHFDRILHKEHEYDIYYSCPNYMKEFDAKTLDEQEVRECFEQTRAGTVTLQFREYDPTKYIKVAKRNKMPMYCEATAQYPYRLFSCMDAISASAALLEQRYHQYDMAILTRIDLLDSIVRVSCIAAWNEGRDDIDPCVYAWRTTPYESMEHVEDRFIYGSPGFLLRFKDAFNYLVGVQHTDQDLFNERLLYKFVTHAIPLSHIKMQHGLQMAPLGDRIMYKYSDHVKTKTMELYAIE